MAATQKEIAALLNVSVNTVSRALKDMPDIGLDTRKRVKEAASALGYRPNLTARSLVLKKSFMIGVAISEPDNPVRLEFCEKLRALAAADGYRVIIAGLSPFDHDKDRVVVEELLACGIDALVVGYLSGILAEQPLGKVLEDCRKSGTSTVVFGCAETGLADNIRIDFAESAERLTEYLLERKRNPIILTRCPDPNNDFRYQGYLTALKRHGMEAKASYWPIGDHRLSAGKEAMNAYLKQIGKVPDAVIAPNDLAAIGVMTALREYGVKIPQECAVVGFDNTEFGAFAEPPLTSIGFCNDLFANTVWSLLKRRLNGEYDLPCRQVKLTQELVKRKSV